MAASAGQDSELELVFVSSDRSEAEFHEYYNSMPWLALPYQQRDLKEKLSELFQVHTTFCEWVC
jgi:nucleoredoxin